MRVCISRDFNLFEVTSPRSWWNVRCNFILRLEARRCELFVELVKRQMKRCLLLVEKSRCLQHAGLLNGLLPLD